MAERKRLFISYKRNINPDEGIARQAHSVLARDHEVFIDQEMLPGTRWAETIETELRKSDVLIPFLSAESLGSEMVRAEIEMAHKLGKQQGRPAILPVRLAYTGDYPHPLNAWLDPIQWAFWGGSDDTPRLIALLQKAILAGALPEAAPVPRERPPAVPEGASPGPTPQAQPTRLERPGGAIAAESAFYVERPSDRVALETIADQGVTLVVKAPRQMGKSSLLIRTMESAAAAGKRVAFVDFQLFETEVLRNADLFFQQFCSLVADDLGLEDRSEEFWGMPLGNSQRCTRFFGRYLLEALEAPLYLAMDEVDAVFDSSFRSDFFGMLRSWHNQRSRPGSAWKRLDLALVTSTEPYQLIEDLNQSPFNVGEILELEDFTAREAAGLNQRHGSPLSGGELEALMDLVGGQPFLLRRALYLVASGRSSFADLLAAATDDRGPFGDHLRYHLFRIHDKEELVKGLLQVFDHHRCQSEETFWRLRGAGLVRREGGEELPRSTLYERYFREHLGV